MDVDDALAAGELPDVDTDDDAALGTVVRRGRRARRARLATSIAGAVAVAVVALVAVGGSGGEDTVGVATDDAGTAPATSAPLDPAADPGPAGKPGLDDARWSGAALGLGSWTGARTSPDGRTLVVTFVGGPPYVEGQYCTTAYRAEAVESATMVEVEIQRYSPPPPPSDDGVFGCTSAGYFRSVEVELDEPLGERTLVEVEFDRPQPVFDGALLAEPGWLPDGWSLRQEQAGFPEPETATAWRRTWGGEPPPPTDDGHCTPGDSGISLTQGPPGRPALDLGLLPPVSTHDVHGAAATHHVGGPTNPGITVLVWEAAGQTFTLDSVPSCAGEGAASVGRLLELARGLVLPGE